MSVLNFNFVEMLGIGCFIESFLARTNLQCPHHAILLEPPGINLTNEVMQEVLRFFGTYGIFFASTDVASADVASAGVATVDVASVDVVSVDVVSVDVASVAVASVDVESVDVTSADVASVDIASVDVASAGVASYTLVDTPKICPLIWAIKFFRAWLWRDLI